ncbi:MAG: hypothetical protein JXR37_31855 [Kiritimatiellae bacterium]|nr:hypothetical protein [Kiritimatiellia bacterium]
MTTATARKIAFPEYTTYDPEIPVWCITPKSGPTIHRFFDTSPVSRSGRYVGLTRFPYEDRLPTPGDKAEIVVVDLEQGTQEVVARTAGWDTQLGAHTQWGKDDTCLCYNEVDTQTWRPYGVVLNPFTGEKKVLEGGIYMVSPDGRFAANPCLLRTARTQAGYGVLAPDAAIPHNDGAPDDDGIWVTDLETGKADLRVSLRRIVEAVLTPEERAKRGFYGAHVKWSLDGERLMLVLRGISSDPDAKERMSKNVVTLKADGTDIHVAIPSSEWRKGGHHPNWCPDSEYVMMNLNCHGAGAGLRFVKARYDGTDYGPMTDAVPGSGHPALHPNGRHIVTDAYPREPTAFGDGTTPIRFVDVKAGTARNIVRINANPPFQGPKNELRVDPHPAWDYAFERSVFNGYLDGARRVFLAELSGLV